MKAQVSEVFDSIQGEGIYMGERHVFVRFLGCNMRCKYCDTQLSRYAEFEPEELLAQIKKCRKGAVVISYTGGEPLLQVEFLKVMMPLAQKSGFRNYLETNGTLHEALAQVIDFVNVIAMDVKLPSSTGQEAVWEQQKQFLRTALKKDVFLKVVVCESTSEEDVQKMIDMIKDIHCAVTVVFQPDNGEDKELLRLKAEKYRQMCFQQSIATCFIPQMHKLIGFK